MAIVLSGTTNDITVNGVSVATDAEVSSAVASGVAPKANTADLKEIGVEQTWQDVTASRALGATYTNSTGKPLFLGIEGTLGVGNYDVSVSVNINGYTQRIAVNSSPSGTTNVAGTILIPAGATYSVSMTVASLSKWSELR